MLAKASKPESIGVGVCFQYHFEEDMDSCFDAWPKDLYEDQVRP
jgi:hypothetical protein